MRTYSYVRYNTVIIIVIIVVIVVVISIIITIIMIIMWGERERKYLHQSGENKNSAAVYKYFLRNKTSTIK